jgi:Mg2+ and Co2+ transporter CorA
MSRKDGTSFGESFDTDDLRNELVDLGPRLQELSVFRSRLMWYEDEMILNLERLGIAQDGSKNWPPSSQSLSLEAAKKDLYAAFLRLQLYKSRTDSLTGTVTDYVSLRGDLRSLSVERFGMRLTVLGAIFFPVTLVAAIFSMGENFKPGARQFWIPWVVAIPLVLLMGAYLLVPDWLKRKFPTQSSVMLNPTTGRSAR